MTAQISHIDRTKLYKDTLYRFNYVAKFVDFGEDDIKALKGAAPLIGPLVPAIVDAVYQRLFSFDITKETFLARGENFHGHVASNLDELTTENEQIKFRKNFLGKYLVKLVTAEYDEKFIKYLEWVGRIHTDTPEKKSKINVEYIHVNALFGWLHGFLASAIDQHPELQSDPVRRAKLLSALSKLLWIQNDLFAKFYVKDGADVVGNNTSSSWLKSQQGTSALICVSGVLVGMASMFLVMKKN
ncbi:hypothetical protein HDU76_006692 [Blyttiomyces sp. JEL0837]|nr:hypothetical protein HDU76_006692 [Blyttiomyces sp. JEL0837]